MLRIIQLLIVLNLSQFSRSEDLLCSELSTNKEKCDALEWCLYDKFAKQCIDFDYCKAILSQDSCDAKPGCESLLEFCSGADGSCQVMQNQSDCETLKCLWTPLKCLMKTRVDQSWTQLYSDFDTNDFTQMNGWSIYNDGVEMDQQEKFSTCGNVKLVGGYNIFGKGSMAQKEIAVPPHYRLKLKIQLWKIDSWDNESFIISIDGRNWQIAQQVNQGKERCGLLYNWRENIIYSEIVFDHTAPTAHIIITTTLDELASNESWGFRDVTLSYIACPDDCVTCSNKDSSTCRDYTLVNQSWMDQSISAQKWNVAKGIAEPYSCVGNNLFGGYKHFGRDSEIERAFENLPPHFELLVRFQFWKLDSWDLEEMKVVIDGMDVYIRSFSMNEGLKLCGNKDQVDQIVDVQISIPHSNTKALMNIKTNLDSDAQNESWGIRIFQLFVSQCAQYCTQCIGGAENQCTQCDLTHSLVAGQCISITRWNLAFSEFQDKNLQYLDNWTVNSVFDTKKGLITTCQDNQIFGGYMKFGRATKIQRDLEIPQHQQYKINLQIIIINEYYWQFDEIQILNREQKVYSVQPDKVNTPWTYGGCGGYFSTKTIDVEILSDDLSTSLSIQIQSNQTSDADTQSWGIRNLNITYISAPKCVIFFSDCQYTGRKFQICQSDSEFMAKQMQTVKSFRKSSDLTVVGINPAGLTDTCFNRQVRCMKGFNTNTNTSHIIQNWLLLNSNIATCPSPFRITPYYYGRDNEYGFGPLLMNKASSIQQEDVESDDQQENAADQSIQYDD